MPRTKWPTHKQANITQGLTASAPATQDFSPTEEIGVAGVKLTSGFVHDEFLPQLIGERGQRTYREMRDNDSVIGAMMFALEMLIRAVPWKFESVNPDSPDSEENVEFVQGVFDDMEHTMSDFLADVATMFTFGWQWTEMVLKIRRGPEEREPQFRSKFTDGRYGFRKLANRAQETLWQWDQDEQGELFGMRQQPPVSGTIRYIPRSKSMLFRPHQHKGSPEGRSILRNAYVSYYYLKRLQRIEATGHERNLNGLPVAKVPSNVINGNDASQGKAMQDYERLVRDIKFDEQGGVIIPSDPYVDETGRPTNIPKVDLMLLSASGNTQSNGMNETILRYQRDIARTILADFIMMGSDNRASFGALASNKTSIFSNAVDGYAQVIASVVNREAIPYLWRMNGMNMDSLVEAVPGKINPVDIEMLGNYIRDISGAGAQLFPDDDLENFLREIASLPRKPDELMTDDGDLQDLVRQQNRIQDAGEDTPPQQREEA